MQNTIHIYHLYSHQEMWLLFAERKYEEAISFKYLNLSSTYILNTKQNLIAELL